MKFIIVQNRCFACELVRAKFHAEQQVMADDLVLRIIRGCEGGLFDDL